MDNGQINIYGKYLYEIPVLQEHKMIQNKNRIDQSITDIQIEYIGVGPYYGFQVDGNQRFLLKDFTVVHNTTFLENMCYYHKHRYPVARIFMGTEDGYKRFCGIFGHLYVSNHYDEQQEKEHIYRQKLMTIENDKGYTGNYAINICDDVSDDPKIYKTPVMRGLFKLGSQHWNQLFMVGSQYAIDMPPDIRNSCSYIAIFRTPDSIEREKLYKNFGGITGTYSDFCSLLDQITGDYTCLIIKKRSQSNKLEECVFYYQTKVLKTWKFGCDEYMSWGKNRYNKDYTEKIIV
jgi:hypothetical protein